MAEINTHTVSKHTVEIRIPTYKRPALLRRALNSVLEQSYSDWLAIVFDDSPGQEGQPVVQSLNDPRLIYQPNDKNLGGSANIDQAFYSGSYIEGSEFATILEDDNWWYPEFLQKNIEALPLSRSELAVSAKLVRDGHATSAFAGIGRHARR